jgi:RNAse (barnase) inhibitor barstar
MEDVNKICVLDGEKVQTKNELITEIGAGFGWNGYLGNNFDALEEVINDEELIKNSSFILIIINADKVLIKESDEQKEIFMQILKDAEEEWAKKDKMFKVILESNEI